MAFWDVVIPATFTEGCDAGVVCFGSNFEPVNDSSVGQVLGVILGVSLAAILLIVAVAIGCMWKMKNRKLSGPSQSRSTIPRISFKNPVVKNAEGNNQEEEHEIPQMVI